MSIMPDNTPKGEVERSGSAKPMLFEIHGFICNGKRIDELRPLQLDGEPEFYAEVVIQTPSGGLSTMARIPGVKTVQDAYVMFQAVWDATLNKLREEATKPKIVLPGDLRLGGNNGPKRRFGGD